MAVLCPSRPEHDRFANTGSGKVLPAFARRPWLRNIDIRDQILDGGTYGGASAIAALAAGSRVLPMGISPSAVPASCLVNHHIRPGADGNLTPDGALDLNETNILIQTVRMTLVTSIVDALWPCG